MWPGHILYSARAFPFLIRLASLTSSDFIKGLIDNFHFLADHQEFLVALKFMLDEGPSYGLFLQPAETEVLISECSHEEEVYQRYKNYMSVLKIDEQSADRI